jgi:hypothetical protein
MVFSQEQWHMRVSTLALAAGLLAATGIAVVQFSPAAGQTGPGWVTLVDGKTMGDWNVIGEANWRIEDGALVADKRGKVNAYLSTKTSYKDLQIHAEFWASDDANSGIFFRCKDPKSIGAKVCYEANIYDQAPGDGTGALTGFARPDPKVKAAGRWSTIEVTARGSHIVVTTNGQKTAEAKDTTYTEGVVALQYLAGAIKFRKVAVKPL